MTNYGTIPASTAPGGTNLDFLSRGKERFRSGLADRRPWKEMFDRHSINLPGNFREAIGRIRTNLAYFQLNYAIIVLGILFLGLLWHPFSLIVLIVMIGFWLFLYFLRDEPLVVFHYTIADSVVLGVLAVLTVGFLFFTNATANILYSLLVGGVLVLVHAAFRRSDDLFEDVEGGATAALVHGGPSSSK